MWVAISSGNANNILKTPLPPDSLTNIKCLEKFGQNFSLRCSGSVVTLACLLSPDAASLLRSEANGVGWRRLGTAHPPQHWHHDHIGAPHQHITVPPFATPKVPRRRCDAPSVLPDQVRTHRPETRNSHPGVGFQRKPGPDPHRQLRPQHGTNNKHTHAQGW